jgi:HK97 family phage major capsid protein
MAPELKDKLNEVNEQIAEQRQDAQSKWQAFESAREKFAKAGEDANNTESEAFKELDAVNKEYSTAAESLADLEKVRDGLFRAMGGEEPPKLGGDDPTIGAEARRQVRESVKSLGSQAIEGDAYEALKASGALSNSKAGFNTVLAQESVEELMAALLTGVSDTSAGAFVVPEQKGYFPLPQRPRTVLDLITTGTTESDMVEFVRQTGFTNNAAAVAEATSQTTGTKPESSLSFVKVPESVKQIAHWMATTRRALADAGQLTTIIDNQLRYGLEFVLENLVVAGNGEGENLRGILKTPGILKQEKGSLSVADAIHKALTQVRLGFLEPNGVAMNPLDWEDVRLSRDDSGASAGTGGYLFGPPSTAGAEQIWGKPVAISPALSAGTGIVADFRYATLWLREGTQVLAMDQHSDWAIKNLVLLLAEMRAAFGVQVTTAFCEVTGL